MALTCALHDIGLLLGAQAATTDAASVVPALAIAGAALVVVIASAGVLVALERSATLRGSVSKGIPGVADYAVSRRST